MGKMELTRDEIVREVERLKLEKKKIVFTNGCFDILHVGHIRYLKEAKNQGDILIVGLNSDSSVRSLKGPDRPINGEGERAEVLSALKPVDYVVIFSELDPKSLIMDIRPDVLVKGEDWNEDEIIGAAEVKSWGGRVVRAGLAPGSSTTSLIEKIRK